MRLDIKKLKTQLTLQGHEKIINSLDIPIIHKADNIWSLKSMCHSKTEDCGENLKLYTDSLTYTCFSHGCLNGSDIIALVQTRKMLFDKSFTFMDSVNYIIDTLDLSIEHLTRKTHQKETFNWDKFFGRYIRHESVYDDNEVYDESIIGFFEVVYPLEWINEGISIESMAKYKIGYYPRLQATTIPCFNENNELTGVRGRFWKPKDIEHGKYRPIQLLNGIIYSFPLSTSFYGVNHNLKIIQRKKQVILVESEKAVLRSDTWFGEESITLGMYGKTLSKYKANQLIKWGIEKCVICIDNDWKCVNSEEYEKFVQNVNKIWELLHAYMKVEVMYNNLGYTDMYKQNAFDFDRDRFDRLWKEREYIE